MKVLIAEEFLEIARKLCLILLSLGIKGVPAGNREEALEVLKREPDIRIGIIDVDNRSVEGYVLIEDIYRNLGDNFRFIIHSALIMDDLPQEIMTRNIIGHILKPFDEARVESSIKIVFSSINFPDIDKRQHIRVVPDKDDLIRVHFKFPAHSRQGYGKVLNISLGGIAVELLGTQDPVFLTEGEKIPFLEFPVNCQPVSASGVVILKRGKVLAVRFLSLAKAEKKILAKYIYKKISA